jgi:hypothetical protein
MDAEAAIQDVVIRAIVVVVRRLIHWRLSAAALASTSWPVLRYTPLP